MGKSVIIIGAGVSGLSTSCYAQMNGYQSRIFEHHCAAGGVAASWKRGSYNIDGGIHFMMNHKPGTALYKIYEELGVSRPELFTDMDTYGKFIDERSGYNVTITKDLNLLSHNLKSVSPKDGAYIDELINGSQVFRGLDMSEIGMGKPPELVNLIDKLKDTLAMRQVFKYFSGKYAKSVASFTEDLRDRRLADFLKSLFLAEVPVWFIFMILALLADGQLAYLSGGCSEFIGGMEKRYKDLGGEITYNSTVDKILVESNRVVGVRLADGSEHYADAVISAADGYSTIFKMLSGKFLDNEIKERYNNWPLFKPFIMVSYGVTREFPEESAFTSIKLARPLKVAGSDMEDLFIRIFNYSPKFAPKGKSVIQAEFETEWDYWNTLRASNKTEYNAEKERIASDILNRLEDYYPEISSQIEVTDVATPYTTWRYTLNHKGSWEGWMISPETINVSVKRTLPGLKNFYMAGQWVMPGGGIPPCLYSGKHAIQLLCKRDKKHFTTKHG